MASETTFDHWKVGFLMSKSEKKGPEAMKLLYNILEVNRISKQFSDQNFVQKWLRNKLLHFWQD